MPTIRDGHIESLGNIPYFLDSLKLNFGFSFFVIELYIQGQKSLFTLF